MPVIHPKPAKVARRRQPRAQWLRVLLTPQEIRYIDRLAETGIHGTTREEVALNLIDRGLQDNYKTFLGPESPVRYHD